MLVKRALPSLVTKQHEQEGINHLPEQRHSEAPKKKLSRPVLKSPSIFPPLVAQGESVALKMFDDRKHGRIENTYRKGCYYATKN